MRENPVLSGVETAIQHLAQDMAQSLPVTVASVALWDQPSLSLRVKAVSGARSLPQPLAVGTRLSLSDAQWHRAVLESESPVLLERHARPDALSSDAVCQSLLPNLHSIYLVPIQLNDEILGVLALGEMRSPEREPIDARKQQRCHALLEEFLAVSAHAWEAGRLRRQIGAMSSLLRIALEMLEVRSYQGVLACVGSEVSDWLGTPVKAVLLRVTQAGRLETIARWNALEDVDETSAIQLLTALARAENGSGWPISVARVADDPLDPLYARAQAGEAWTRICLPIMGRDRLMGLACLYVEDDLRLSEWDLDAFKRRAEIVAVGMGVVTALDEHRDEREWLGRAAWEILTTHRRAVLQEAVTGIIGLVSSRLNARLQPLGDGGEGSEGDLRRLAETVAEDVSAILQELSAAATGSDDSRFVTIEINDLVRRAVEITRTKWEDGPRRRGVIVDLHFEPHPEPLVMEGLVGLVGAVVHAIENAVEAIPEGGRIRLRTGRDDGHVVISVADSGPGLPEGLDRDVFAPLVSTKGTLGLGLSVVRAFAKRHGGEATLSCGESGTTLMLRLPATAARE